MAEGLKEEMDLKEEDLKEGENQPHVELANKMYDDYLREEGDDEEKSKTFKLEDILKIMTGVDRHGNEVGNQYGP